MHCTNCGAALQEGAAVCPVCNTPVSGPSETADAANPEAANAEAPVEAPAEAPVEAAVPLVPAAPAAPAVQAQSASGAHTGWSDKLEDPAIKKAADKQRKAARVFGVIFALVFLIGFIAAGVLIPAVPLKEAVIAGVVLALIMLAVAFFRLLGLNKPIWEGTVADKTAKERADSKDSSKSHTLYTLTFKGIGGGHKHLRIKDDAGLYNYFDVGDKVRYYPVFGTYEKRDKAGDAIIFCNVCGASNPMENSVCSRCKNPLFK